MPKFKIYLNSHIFTMHSFKLVRINMNLFTVKTSLQLKSMNMVKTASWNKQHLISLLAS